MTAAASARHGLSYEALTQQAMALPEVEESTSYNTPALKVRGKLMVRLKEDGDSIVLRTTWDERERLMAIYPEAFYLTDHYRNHALVLMRLSAAPQDGTVARVLEHAWLQVAPKSLLARHPSLRQA
jgi:hypothetical protein